MEKSDKKSLKRVDALDALRGLAILAMVLSGAIPFGDVMPAWMYHAQVPPPNHVFNADLPGITWVDLVFPFFLFAMGAAFPLALNKKIEAGIPKWKISLQALQRGLMLAVFAIYIQHIKPYAIMSSPDTKTWLASIFGYFLLFPMFLRFPKSINPIIGWTIKIAGYAAGFILIFTMTYNGKPFTVTRSDIIILVLANVAFFGSVIWVYTKDNHLLRLSVFGFLIAIRLTQSIPGTWNNLLWNATPAAWLYKLYYLQYLFIVLPGTIAGDFILKWLKAKDDAIPNRFENEKLKYGLALLLLILFLPLNVIGLYIRALNITFAADILFCLIGLLLFRRENNSFGLFCNSLFRWGIYWLILGLFFEAFEGGIKKDHPTISYYFITTGLAYFTIIFLSIIVDFFDNRKGLNILIANGQNPMIAYITGSCLLWPLLAVTGLLPLFNKLDTNAWLGLLKGTLFTAAVALITMLCTRFKLFWRT